MTKNRKLFEEIEERSDITKASSIENVSIEQTSWLSIWLWTLLVSLISLILVGGWTRLTDSGLSIVEWKPITGMIPPFSSEGWIVEFEKYKNIPEFKLVNFDITMEEFKFIYWWEWGHRQLARFIGLVWFVGFLLLWKMKQIPERWTFYFFGIGLLGALQAFLGWWMVSSGLDGQVVDVFSYRLAIHLTMAFLILALIFWAILFHSENSAKIFESRRYRNKFSVNVLAGLGVLCYVQLALGALVAGIDAGRAYNDWPLMNGKWIPVDLFEYEPFITNFFENSGLVQFNHRLTAYLLFIVVSIIWWANRRNPYLKIRVATNYLMIIVVVQMFLGVITVLYSAPLSLASLHQFTAILFILAYINLLFKTYYPVSQKI
tara:strand:- start:863 stop:1987 length:1125 start_codon:yes stop_codon:yes gene_type:complete